MGIFFFFFFSSRRRHTRLTCDWSSDVCSSDLVLYDWLIAPIESRIDPDRTLIIETDGILGNLPFPALVRPDGLYLETTRSLVFSPGFRYMQKLRAGRLISPEMLALVVGNPSTSNSSGMVPLQDAASEAEQIGRLFANSTLLIGKRATEQAIVKQLHEAD